MIGGRCIQGAAGSTILASGLSLLTVASSGSERLRAVSLWGAASAVGAAAGPLVGGLLVDSAGLAGSVLDRRRDRRGAASRSPLRSIEESRDPTARDRSTGSARCSWPRSSAPLILAVSQGRRLGLGFARRCSLCLAVSVASVFGFIVVEQRSPAPLVDLALMRNKLLIGATLGILIGAGTINGLMFVVSLYFQDPSALAMTPLEAGLATLPATIGLVVSAPLVPKMGGAGSARATVVGARLRPSPRSGSGC